MLKLPKDLKGRFHVGGNGDRNAKPVTRSSGGGFGEAPQMDRAALTTEVNRMWEKSALRVGLITRDDLRKNTDSELLAQLRDRLGEDKVNAMLIEAGLAEPETPEMEPVEGTIGPEEAQNLIFLTQTITERLRELNDAPATKPRLKQLLALGTEMFALLSAMNTPFATLGASDGWQVTAEENVFGLHTPDGEFLENETDITDWLEFEAALHEGSFGDTADE